MLLEGKKLGYLSYSDGDGGAARGALRLHQGMRKLGVDCDMLVRRKVTDAEGVTEYRLPISEKRQRLNHALASTIYPQLRKQSEAVQSFNLRHTGLDRYLNEQSFDALILHWIGADTISLKELGRLNMPLIWRLADQWAFSGSLHFDPRDSGITRSATRLVDNADDFVYRRKQKFWKDLNPHIVCGSRWLADRASESELFGRCPVHVIPSSLDTNLFSPSPQSALNIRCQELGINAQKKTMVFGCAKATSDKRKGFDLLVQSLQHASFKEKDFQLVVFGNEPELTPALPIQTHYIGPVSDDLLLADLYSLADVCVVPSRMDNLPFTAIESLACGTPVVGFNIGGMPDIVNHSVLGELVNPFDTDALAKAIIAVADNFSHAVSQGCRKAAVSEYAVPVQVRRYCELVERVIGE